MRVSAIHVDITEKDLLGIMTEVVEEFVKVDGLSIKTLSIKDNIEVTGEYKKGITLKFMVVLRVLGVQENSISLSIEKVKVLGLPLMKGIVNSVLKLVLKSFDKIGIKAQNGILSVDMNLLSPLIPFVDFKVKAIELLEGGISIEVVELNYDSKKEAMDINKLIGKENNIEAKQKLLQEVKSEESKKEEIIEETKIEVVEVKSKTEDINEKHHKKDNNWESPLTREEMDEFEREFRRADYKKVRDGYTEIRTKVEHKLPEKCAEYSDIIFAVPDLIALACRLFKDNRVSTKNKVIIGIMLGYSLAPIDIIPEKIKIIGKLDDIVIFLIGLNRLLNCVDEKIILENWQGDEEIIRLIKKGISFGADKLGGNVKTAMNVIDALI